MLIASCFPTFAETRLANVLELIVTGVGREDKLPCDAVMQMILLVYLRSRKGVF